MDFFQHQETARRKTGLLIFYFIAAVVLIVLLVYAIVVAGRCCCRGRRERPHVHPVLRSSGTRASSRAVSLGTLALIGGGSLYRVASLAGGGPQRGRDDGRAPALAPDHRPRRAEDPQRRRGDGHRLRHAGAAGVPARAGGRDQRLRRRVHAGRRRHRRHARLHPEPHARRAPGGHRPRVQPHPQRRHAAQHPPDRRALRHPPDQHDRLDHLPLDRRFLPVRRTGATARSAASIPGRWSAWRCTCWAMSGCSSAT